MYYCQDANMYEKVTSVISWNCPSQENANSPGGSPHTTHQGLHNESSKQPPSDEAAIKTGDDADNQEITEASPDQSVMHIEPYVTSTEREDNAGDSSDCEEVTMSGVEELLDSSICNIIRQWNYNTKLSLLILTMLQIRNMTNDDALSPKYFYTYLILLSYYYSYFCVYYHIWILEALLVEIICMNSMRVMTTTACIIICNYDYSILITTHYSYTRTCNPLLPCHHLYCTILV